MRIASLLPATTEILYAIGAGDCVAGVTHECDYPPEARSKPILIRPRLDPAAAPAEVDGRVRELVEQGESIYAVDAELLASLAADLIVTQDLCQVCAASPETLAAALALLPAERRPRVVTFAPHTLADVWRGIAEIGVATECGPQAKTLAAGLSSEVGAIAAVTGAAGTCPGVLCLEWFDPPYVAGHWVPEMVRLAGGRDVLGQEGESSVRVTWQEILSAEPEVIVLMSCGYDLQRNLEVWASTTLPAGWGRLPAVKSGRVYAVDANAYFSRPGPRLAQGVALLAGLFHPESALGNTAEILAGSVRRVDAVASSRSR
jgi:iron complex transport system substrate-binding protein